MSGKKGTEVGNLETGANPEDQGCQWLLPEQRNVKAVSVWHCAATTAPLSCCPSCYAKLSHKDNVCSSTIGKQMKQKKSSSLAKHHLPALDLFWELLCESSSTPSSWSRLGSVASTTWMTLFCVLESQLIPLLLLVLCVLRWPRVVGRTLKPSYYYYLVLCASILPVLSLTAWNWLADVLMIFKNYLKVFISLEWTFMMHCSDLEVGWFYWI